MGFAVMGFAIMIFAIMIFAVLGFATLAFAVVGISQRSEKLSGQKGVEVDEFCLLCYIEHNTQVLRCTERYIHYLLMF